jgi:hypothetical protein
MEGQKVLFLIEKVSIENGKTLYQAVEHETNQPVILKKGISMNTKIDEGKKYWCMVNQNYINLAEAFEEERKVAQKKEEVVVNTNQTTRIDVSTKDLMILYQNQTIPAIEIAKSQYDTITENAVIEIRDKLVQDILSRCKE